MPVASQIACLKDRRRDLNFHQHNDGSGRGDRHRGVQRNTQSAMIGVAGVCVRVRHLGDGQNSYQGQAHHE